MTEPPKPTADDIAALRLAVEHMADGIVHAIAPAFTGRLDPYFVDRAALESLASAGMAVGDWVPIDTATMQPAPGIPVGATVRVNGSNHQGIYRITKVEPRAIGIEPAGNRHQRRKAHALERRKWR